MISLEKLILTPLQNLPKNVGDLGKIIVAKGFKKLPKVQKIATSGHIGGSPGLMVMWGDSCSKGCEFEYQHCILDGHFSHLFDVEL